MTSNLTSFFRRNWLSIIFAAIIIYLMTGVTSTSISEQPMVDGYYAEDDIFVGDRKMGISQSSELQPNYPDLAPTTTQDRLVVVDSSLSLLVDSVSQTIRSIQTLAESSGGYLVDSNLFEPEGAAIGDITMRVPVSQRDIVLTQIKDLGIRVVNEHTSGRDVTDQYTDIEAHLVTLRITQAKFMVLLSSADTVQDSLAVQRELTNLQRQIDSYVGQQKYLAGNAELSRISISLSTDELALPYSPDQPWRPLAVFRSAVRSMLSLGRSIVSIVIWLAVYSPVWIIGFALLYWLKKRSI